MRPYGVLPYGNGDRVGDEQGQHGPTADSPRRTGRVGVLDVPVTALPVGRGLRLMCGGGAFVGLGRVRRLRMHRLRMHRLRMHRLRMHRLRVRLPG
ncbi:hypothetical protein SUDANB51_02449 [Streptomyces sp. enrichment culture]